MKLTVENLSMTIGARVLCRDLSVAIEPGQFWCVLGSNGAGKTTLLRTLAGLRAIDGGSITLEGRALSLWDWRKLAQVRAWAPQGVEDRFSASVYETALTGLYPHHPVGRASRWGFESAEDREDVMAAIARLGLLGFAERDIRTLSAGERQRVAVAALLVQRPRVALLDEPTSHLDLNVQTQVMDVLAEHAGRPGEGNSVVVAIHDLNLAHRYATHVILFMPDQSIVAGPREAVMDPLLLSAAFGHEIVALEALGRKWLVAR